MILSSGAKYNQINFSKNHVSGNARKIGVTVIWWFTVCKDIDELIDICKKYDNMATVAKMKEIVPEFKSNHSVYEVLDKGN